MLRITQSESTQAAKSYFGKSLERGDYYLEGQEIAGNWGGKGSIFLGLSGEIDKDVFCGLIENFRPDGKRLTLRNAENRRPGYDFTFDVPKSVSLLHAIGGDKRIEDAMKRALVETMADIEQEMHTRVRKGGANEDRVTGNMVWADFTHYTSRPTAIDKETEGRLGHITEILRSKNGEVLLPDPHLHVHVYAMNATFDEVENQWKAGVFMYAKRDASYYQAAYHVRLAAELQKLGYEIVPTRNAFEIKGVSNELIKKFSRRTKEVEETAKELCIENIDEKAKLGAKTRHNKIDCLSREELGILWQKVAGESESKHLKAMTSQAKSGLGGLVVDKAEVARDGIRHALNKELERVSDASQRRLLATAMEYGVGSVSVESVVDAFACQPNLVKGTIRGEKRVSTREVLSEESQLFNIIRDGVDDCLPLIRGDYEFKNPLFENASAKEQREAIAGVFSSRDWVCGVIGRAGTGKTTLLKEIEAGLGSVGSKLITVAPTAEASRGVLRGEGFSSADTVKRLLQDKGLHQQLQGSVLWIDEAGMLGNKDTLSLLNLAKEKGVKKVILAGDHTQIRSVPRGDALRFLEERTSMKVWRLQKIQRQKTPQLKEAVEQISQSNILGGFSKLKEMNSISEHTTQELPKAIARAYVDRIAEKNRSVLVVCPTHSEGEKITAEIRKELKSAGLLGPDDKKVMRTVPLGWTDSEKSRAATYEEGMIIQFRKYAKGFIKSERVRVVGVDTEGGRVSVLNNIGEVKDLPLNNPTSFDTYNLADLAVSKGDKLRITQNTTIDGTRYNNGDMVRVFNVSNEGEIELTNGKKLPASFGHLAHGYVHTADASQAKTVDSVLIGIGPDSLGATDMRRAYVAISRARYEAKIFTQDIEELEVAASRDSARNFAADLVGNFDRQKRIFESMRKKEIHHKPKVTIETPHPVIARIIQPPSKEMEMEI